MKQLTLLNHYMRTVCLYLMVLPEKKHLPTLCTPHKQGK